MNAKDIIKYGHGTILETIKDLPSDLQDKVGTTEKWSIKDEFAHLASFELMLEEVLKNVLGQAGPGELSLAFQKSDFNDSEVAKRKSKTWDEVLSEYNQTHEKVEKLMEKFTPEKLREVGTIPWYGPGYSLDDFIVYTNYAHKREHAAHISLFRKREGR